jgi:hypothetical protein
MGGKYSYRSSAPPNANRGAPVVGVGCHRDRTGQNLGRLAGHWDGAGRCPAFALFVPPRVGGDRSLAGRVSARRGREEMKIRIEGANEHNLKDVNVEIGDGLTVVTGVSGSGKTSLVFDTLYHEARRRFLEIFSLGERLTPADVRTVTGLGPAVAVGQNLLNRNPGSTLATASGLHPFLRLFYTHFGERVCATCKTPVAVYVEDEIVDRVASLAQDRSVTLLAPLMRQGLGSHRTLLARLTEQFGPEAVRVDGAPIHPASPGDRPTLEPELPHDIDVVVARIARGGAEADPILIGAIREGLQRVWAMGATAVVALPIRIARRFGRPHSFMSHVRRLCPLWCMVSRTTAYAFPSSVSSLRGQGMRPLRRYRYASGCRGGSLAGPSASRSSGPIRG